MCVAVRTVKSRPRSGATIYCTDKNVRLIIARKTHKKVEIPEITLE